MKPLSFAWLPSLAVLAVVSTVPSVPGEPCPPSPRQLARLPVCELDRLFAAGTACRLPLGTWRGRVLYVVDANRPRLRAQMQSTLWKGKEFHADGTIINLWACCRAVEGRFCPGTSWYDGRPCIVLEYPPDAAVFSNNRDELRELAPGVILGRYYEKCPCPRWIGYFVIEQQGCGRLRSGQ